MKGDEDPLQDRFAYHLARGTWPQPDADVIRLELDATFIAGAATRLALEDHVSGRVDVDTLDDLKLLACELVSNAVMHGGDGPDDRVEVWIGVAARCVRIEVVDPGSGLGLPLSPTPRESGGFGLIIVERIASRWGAANHLGSCVWLELDV